MPDCRNFAIWGSAGHAKVLGALLAARGDRVVALFDNRDVPSAIVGVPLYVGMAGFEEWVRETDSVHTVAGIVAIGGGRGADRLAIQHVFSSNGLIVPAIVHPRAFVCDTAVLGKGTQVLAMAQVAADVRVGDACIINHQASVDHECILADGVHVAPGATLCGCVNVGANVFIGAGSVILPRVSIGENAVIGAGAVVTRDVPANVVVVGNPARLQSSSE